MHACCFPLLQFCGQFERTVEVIDQGIRVSFTSDDPKKAAAARTLVQAFQDLCGDDCCRDQSKSGCC